MVRQRHGSGLLSVRRINVAIGRINGVHMGKEDVLLKCSSLHRAPVAFHGRRARARCLHPPTAPPNTALHSPPAICAVAHHRITLPLRLLLPCSFGGHAHTTHAIQYYTRHPPSLPKRPTNVHLRMCALGKPQDAHSPCCLWNDTLPHRRQLACVFLCLRLPSDGVPVPCRLGGERRRRGVRERCVVTVLFSLLPAPTTATCHHCRVSAS